MPKRERAGRERPTMITAQRIADVLGGEDVLKERVASLRELDRLVRRGLPKRALRTAVEHLALERGAANRLIFRLVPEATYKRRRSALSPAESERTERLARVIATAEHVWDDAADARRFLTTPHPMLGGDTPLECAATELGARATEEILWKIYHGLPA